MIFVSVGSMMPFDRLIRGMDEWAAAHPAVPVLMQIGNGKYEPRHAEFVRMLPVADYRARLDAATLFVAHAGMGSIIAAIEAGRPLVMLPRLQQAGEHNTAHQLATAATIGQRDGLHVAASVEELGALVEALLGGGGAPPAPIARFASDELIGHVRDFIHGVERG